jgi:hypothetical protein
MACAPGPCRTFFDSADAKGPQDSTPEEYLPIRTESRHLPDGLHAFASRRRCCSSCASLPPRITRPETCEKCGVSAYVSCPAGIRRLEFTWQRASPDAVEVVAGWRSRRVAASRWEPLPRFFSLLLGQLHFSPRLPAWLAILRVWNYYGRRRTTISGGLQPCWRESICSRASSR